MNLGYNLRITFERSRASSISLPLQEKKKEFSLHVVRFTSFRAHGDPTCTLSSASWPNYISAALSSQSPGSVTISSTPYFDYELAPLPIQVETGHVAPRTSVDDSIGIDHGNDDKIKAI